MGAAVGTSGSTFARPSPVRARGLVACAARSARARQRPVVARSVAAVCRAVDVVVAAGLAAVARVGSTATGRHGAVVDAFVGSADRRVGAVVTQEPSVRARSFQRHVPLDSLAATDADAAGAAGADAQRSDVRRRAAEWGANGDAGVGATDAIAFLVVRRAAEPRASSVSADAAAGGSPDAERMAASGVEPAAASDA